LSLSLGTVIHDFDFAKRQEKLSCYSRTGIFFSSKNRFTSPTVNVPSKLVGGREGQAAFAIEQFLETLIAGTGLAPDDAGRYELAQLASVAPPFQPVFPTD
jgi:hypothetical protein